MLIPPGLVVTTLLVIAYIAGSELCLPAARIALHTGNMQLWKLACNLVALKEWSLIALGVCFLLLAEQSWRLFTGTLIGRIIGLVTAGLVIGMVLWELSGRMQKKHAAIMIRSLDLVLPANGRQREIYERRHQILKSGTRAEQEQVLHDLICENHVTGEVSGS
jgi:hypothetical protein